MLKEWIAHFKQQAIDQAEAARQSKLAAAQAAARPPTMDNEQSAGSSMVPSKRFKQEDSSGRPGMIRRTPENKESMEEISRIERTLTRLAELEQQAYVEQQQELEREKVQNEQYAREPDDGGFESSYPGSNVPQQRKRRGRQTNNNSNNNNTNNPGQGNKRRKRDYPETGPMPQGDAPYRRMAAENRNPPWGYGAQGEDMGSYKGKGGEEEGGSGADGGGKQNTNNNPNTVDMPILPPTRSMHPPPMLPMPSMPYPYPPAYAPPIPLPPPKVDGREQGITRTDMLSIIERLLDKQSPQLSTAEELLSQAKKKSKGTGGGDTVSVRVPYSNNSAHPDYMYLIQNPVAFKNEILRDLMKVMSEGIQDGLQRSIRTLEEVISSSDNRIVQHRVPGHIFKKKERGVDTNALNSVNAMNTPREPRDFGEIEESSFEGKGSESPVGESKSKGEGREHKEHREHKDQHNTHREHRKSQSQSQPQNPRTQTPIKSSQEQMASLIERGRAHPPLTRTYVRELQEKYSKYEQEIKKCSTAIMKYKKKGKLCGMPPKLKKEVVRFVSKLPYGIDIFPLLGVSLATLEKWIQAFPPAGNGVGGGGGISKRANANTNNMVVLSDEEKGQGNLMNGGTNIINTITNTTNTPKRGRKGRKQKRSESSESSPPQDNQLDSEGEGVMGGNGRRSNNPIRNLNSEGMGEHTDDDEFLTEGAGAILHAEGIAWDDGGRAINANVNNVALPFNVSKIAEQIVDTLNEDLF